MLSSRILARRGKLWYLPNLAYLAVGEDFVLTTVFSPEFSMACAIREAYAATLTVVILIEEQLDGVD